MRTWLTAHLVLFFLSALPLSAVVSIAGAVWMPLEAAAAPAKGKKPHRYTIRRGDSLGSIAERFGVKVSELRKWNGLKSDVIYVDRTLKVYPRKPIRVKRVVEVPVQKGATLGGIAKEQGVTVKDLMRWNRLRSPRHLRAGQTLKIETFGPENPSEAKGRPQAGTLKNGEQMPLEHPCYHLKRKRNAWGTNETIEQLLMAIQTVCKSKALKRKRGKAGMPKLVVGDISKKTGGFLPPHKSHQNGRDVDLGYYHVGKKAPKGFRNVTRETMDMDLNWALLDQFLKQDALEYIFMDRSVQRWMVEWGLENGKSKKELRRLFQYPKGRGGTLIRHEPGHLNHIHVRFRCPASDENCY